MLRQGVPAQCDRSYNGNKQRIFPALVHETIQSYIAPSLYLADQHHIRQHYHSQSFRYRHRILISQRINIVRKSQPFALKMCYGRHATKLSRFAALDASQLSDQLLREVTPSIEAPQDDTLLDAANTQPRIFERIFHLDGSEDITASIDFLLQNAQRSRLVEIPSDSLDAESQFAAQNVVRMRHRLWLNGGQDMGMDEDFRIIHIRGRSAREDGTFLIRLNDDQVSPDAAHGSPSQEEASDEIAAPTHAMMQVTHLEFEGVYAPTVFTHRQRRASTDKRLYDIATRINIFRGHPYEQTCLPNEFMAYLDKLQDCFNQLCEMPHDLEEETLDGFDRALDQIERTACLTLLHHRPLEIATAPLPEPHSPASLVDSAHSPTPVLSPLPTPTSRLRIRSGRSTSSTSNASSSHEEHQQHPATTTLLSALLTVLTSAQQMLDSPDLPSRTTFSATRQAFEAVVARASDDPSNVPQEVQDLLKTAQEYFHLLTRKAFSGMEDPDESLEEDAAAARSPKA